MKKDPRVHTNFSLCAHEIFSVCIKTILGMHTLCIKVYWMN